MERISRVIFMKTGDFRGEVMDKVLSNVKAFIFDLDGTLIDTERIYRIMWPKAIAQMGFEFSDERFLSLRSLGRPFAPAKFKEWFGEDFDYDEARRIRKKFFDEYVAANGIDRKKGAVELLTFLHEKGIITAIATATDPVRAKEYLEKTGLDGYFDKVISATMVDEGKPSPKVYKYACSQLGLRPEECAAVEDAPNGVISASDAGLNVIMVPDLTGPDEELKKRLTLCVDSLDMIENYI